MGNQTNKYLPDYPLPEEDDCPSGATKEELFRKSENYKKYYMKNTNKCIERLTKKYLNTRTNFDNKQVNSIINMHIIKQIVKTCVKDSSSETLG